MTTQTLPFRPTPSPVRTPESSKSKSELGKVASSNRIAPNESTDGEIKDTATLTHSHSHETVGAKRPAGPKVEKLRQWSLQHLPGPIGGAVDAVIGLTTGEVRDYTYRCSKSFETEEQAQAAFGQAEQRMIDPNGWFALGMTNKVTGKPFGPNYTLCDPNGTPVDREAEIGDRLNIKLPLQPRHSWVEVDSLQRSPEQTDLTVRPCPNPKEGPEAAVSHMHTANTTNNFSLSRDGKTLTVEITAPHEDLNTDGSIFAKAQNVLNLGLGWAGIKESLWSKAAEGILQGPPTRTSLAKRCFDSAMSLV